MNVFHFTLAWALNVLYYKQNVEYQLSGNHIPLCWVGDLLVANLYLNYIIQLAIALSSFLSSRKLHKCDTARSFSTKIFESLPDLPQAIPCVPWWISHSVVDFRLDLRHHASRRPFDTRKPPRHRSLEISIWCGSPWWIREFSREHCYTIAILRAPQLERCCNVLEIAHQSIHVRKCHGIVGEAGR